LRFVFCKSKSKSFAKKKKSKVVPFALAGRNPEPRMRVGMPCPAFRWAHGDVHASFPIPLSLSQDGRVFARLSTQ
jgi:hypothetical protein